jgi:ATP-dependent exoDNAse (exonuclease V) alpha subunit
MDTLTTEQKNVIKFLQNKKNIYLRGAAGTGKTYTIVCVKQWALERNIKIGITAMTGCASLLISGSTLHSFLGIGLASKSAEELASFTSSKRKFIATKLKKLQLLVIDEISMLDKTLFEKISQYLKLLRNNDLPFGGVQLLLCGDFCQLPPVNGKYCFNSELWDILNLQECYLTKSFRQSGDSTFQNLLESIRQCSLKPEDIEILNKLQKTEFKFGIKPTKLYPLCANIDEINEYYYQKLIKSGESNYTYNRYISDLAKNDLIWVEKQNIPDTNKLSVGCQVFVTHNVSIDDKIVNGTRGVIVQLSEINATIRKTDGELYTVSLHTVRHEDHEDIWIQFMPLRLAFALTIHKSQGMTLDAIEIDLGKNIFEYGQAYTAISRAKNLDSIRLVHFDPKAFKTHGDVLKFYSKS